MANASQGRAELRALGQHPFIVGGICGPPFVGFLLSRVDPLSWRSTRHLGEADGCMIAAIGRAFEVYMESHEGLYSPALSPPNLCRLLQRRSDCHTSLGVRNYGGTRTFGVRSRVIEDAWIKTEAKSVTRRAIRNLRRDP